MLPVAIEREAEGLVPRRLGREGEIEGDHFRAGLDQALQDEGVNLARPGPGFAHQFQRPGLERGAAGEIVELLDVGGVETDGIGIDREKNKIGIGGGGAAMRADGIALERAKPE